MLEPVQMETQIAGQKMIFFSIAFMFSTIYLTLEGLKFFVKHEYYRFLSIIVIVYSIHV